MDSVHLLELTIKDAWRTNRVASALLLDIEGAFPNAVTKQLIHNMRQRRLPWELMEFTECMLTNRKTQLKFNDFTSEWFPVTNSMWSRRSPLDDLLSDLQLGPSGSS